MSLENGTVSLRRFYTNKSLPAPSNPIWLEKLIEYKVQEVNLEQDMENDGWAVHGNELSTEFNEKNIRTGQYISFSYRCDTHRIAMNIVELHLKSQLSLANDHGELINKSTELEMKEDIIGDLLAKTLPNIEIAGVLVDTHEGIVYYTSGSSRLIDKLCGLFQDTFEIGLIEVTYESSATRLLDDAVLTRSLMNQPATLLVTDLELHPDYIDPPEIRMGSSFLTWFFYYLQASESIWVSENTEEIFVIVEDELSLAGETFGSREVTIKKGDINNCKELIAAFSAGKRISKIKLTFFRGELDNGTVWSFNLDKKNFSLASLKTPKPDAVDSFGVKLERFDNINEIHAILDDIYNDYLNLRTSKGWFEIEEDMQEWVKELNEINNPVKATFKEDKEEKEDKKEPFLENEKKKENLSVESEALNDENIPKETVTSTEISDTIPKKNQEPYVISQENLDD